MCVVARVQSVTCCGLTRTTAEAGVYRHVALGTRSVKTSRRRLITVTEWRLSHVHISWSWRYVICNRDIGPSPFHCISAAASTSGSALAAASDIHRQMPTYMADIRRDWLTNQNTDWCFVVIGLVNRQVVGSPLLQLKIDPVCQMGPPYWLAASGCRRIFINICAQYGIQKNIYIHPWLWHSFHVFWSIFNPLMPTVAIWVQSLQ